MPYANTCDSVQGLSIDNKITIFDCNTPYVDRYFIWTALTRSTDLNNVQIYKHSKEEVMSLKRSWVRLYFNQKIQGYKQQDKKMVDNTIAMIISTLNGLNYNIGPIKSVHYVMCHLRFLFLKTTR